jgi:hypothetical protein
MLLGVVCVEESDGSTIIFVPLGVRIWAVQGRKRCNCMCSGSARMWEQLCSPGESNSDHEVTPYPTHPSAPQNFELKKNKKSTDLRHHNKIKIGNK